jgi:Cu/Ag efflux protein CusF
MEIATVIPEDAIMNKDVLTPNDSIAFSKFISPVIGNKHIIIKVDTEIGKASVSHNNIQPINKPTAEVIAEVSPKHPGTNEKTKTIKTEEITIIDFFEFDIFITY